ILFRAAEFEDEDPDLLKYTIVNPGLVMMRPKLAREKPYPPEDLAGIREALELLTKSKVEPIKPELSPLAKRSAGPDGVDPWNPSNPLNSDDSGPKQPGSLMGGGAMPPPTTDGPAPPAGPGGGLNRIHGAQPYDIVNNAIENMPIPKMALIRIIDATVEPG